MIHPHGETRDQWELVREVFDRRNALRREESGGAP